MCSCLLFCCLFLCDYVCLKHLGCAGSVLCVCMLCFMISMCMCVFGLLWVVVGRLCFVVCYVNCGGIVGNRLLVCVCRVVACVVLCYVVWVCCVVIVFVLCCLFYCWFCLLRVMCFVCDLCLYRWDVVFWLCVL